MGDEPTGRFGRWGQAASALGTFGVLSFVIVYANLHLLIGAATWVMLVASIPIAIFSLAWGFTVVDDDEEALEAADEDDDFEFALIRPKSFSDLARRVGGMAAGIYGLFALVALGSLLIGESTRDWPAWLWATVLTVGFAFAFLMEMTTLGAEESAADDSPPTDHEA